MVKVAPLFLLVAAFTLAFDEVGRGGLLRRVQQMCHGHALLVEGVPIERTILEL